MDATPPPAPVVVESPASAPPLVTESVVSTRESSATARGSELRYVDFGAGPFMMAGVGTSGVMGPSAYVRTAISQTTLLRVSGAFGESTGGAARTVWGAGRADLCMDTAGNYASGAGLWLDLCGGADVGATHFPSLSTLVATVPSQTFPYLGLGPNVGLGGELGRDAAIVLRGILDVNVFRQTFLDGSGTATTPSFVAARFELELAFWL